MVDTNGPEQCTKDADLLVKQVQKFSETRRGKNGSTSVRCDGLQIRSNCSVNMETQTFKIYQKVETNVIVETKMTETPCTWHVRVFLFFLNYYYIYTL